VDHRNVVNTSRQAQRGPPNNIGIVCAQETRASGMFLCSCFTGPVGIVCERSVVVVEDNSQETRASGMFLCSCFTGPVGSVCERSVVVVKDNSSYVLVLVHLGSVCNNSVQKNTKQGTTNKGTTCSLV